MLSSSLLIDMQITIFLFFFTRSRVLAYIKRVTMSVVSSLADSISPAIDLKSANGSDDLRRIDFTKNQSSGKKFVLYFKLLEVIQNLVENNQYSTKRYFYMLLSILALTIWSQTNLRDIFYQFKHLFKSQQTLDILINHASRTIGVPRCSLNIVSLLLASFYRIDIVNKPHMCKLADNTNWSCSWWFGLVFQRPSSHRLSC